MLLAGSANSDWYLGLTLGFIIVTVVVIVVAVILSYASRISDQTRLANEGLEEVRTGTAPLWEVRKTNASGVAILEAARTARAAVIATVTGSAPTAEAPPRSEPQILQPQPARPGRLTFEPAQPEPPRPEPPVSEPAQSEGEISWPPTSEPAPGEASAAPGATGEDVSPQVRRLRRRRAVNRGGRA